jgi:DNA-binding IclR family transcriptional regulator
MAKPLTPLESAALATIVDTQSESDGWLDLTRICSRTGRHLADVRQAVARLVRYRLVEIDETAPNTERWLRFGLPTPSTTD